MALVLPAARPALRVREALRGDGPALQAAMARCTHGGELSFTVVNTPDFFGRARAYECARVFLAERGGEIAGSAAVTVRDVLVGGRLERVGYEFQFFTTPEFRRQGVAQALRAAIEAWLRAERATLSSALIADSNHASLALFAREGFRRQRDLSLAFLDVQPARPSDPAGIRRATPADLPALARLLRQAADGRDFATRVDEAALARFIARIPSLDWDDLLLLEANGELLACAGCWDWSAIMEFRIRSVAPSSPLAATFRPGQLLRQWGLTLLAGRDPASLARLLAAVHDHALAAGIDQIGFLREPDDPVLATLEGQRLSTLGVGLYLKPLVGDAPPSAPVLIDTLDL